MASYRSWRETLLTVSERDSVYGEGRRTDLSVQAYVPLPSLQGALRAARHSRILSVVQFQLQSLVALFPAPPLPPATALDVGRAPPEVAPELAVGRLPVVAVAVTPPACRFQTGTPRPARGEADVTAVRPRSKRAEVEAEEDRIFRCRRSICQEVFEVVRRSSGSALARPPTGTFTLRVFALSPSPSSEASFALPLSADPHSWLVWQKLHTLGQVPRSRVSEMHVTGPGPSRLRHGEWWSFSSSDPPCLTPLAVPQEASQFALEARIPAASPPASTPGTVSTRSPVRTGQLQSRLLPLRTIPLQALPVPLGTCRDGHIHRLHSRPQGHLEQE